MFARRLSRHTPRLDQLRTLFRTFSTDVTVYPRRNGTASVTWASNPRADVIVEFASTETDTSPPITGPQAEDFKSASNGSVHVINDTSRRRLLLKLSEEKTKPTVGDIRSAVSAAISTSSKLKNVNSVSFNLQSKLLTDDMRKAAVQAALLTNYHFDAYLSPESKEKRGRIIPELAFDGGDESVGTKCAATVFARDVANERSNVMTPARVEEIASEVARERGLEMTVLRGDELLSQGLRLFHAVGQCAEVPPRLICLYHRGDPSNTKPTVAFVGKGICFDTGGLNLKPTGSIETMHYDKGGAACVLAAADAVGKLNIKRNVVFALALAENAIGSKAYKPHQIIKSLKGPTVEVRNTDAEGRLVLADAMWYVQQQYKPTTLIDVATLTGAIVVGLGECVAGLFSNDDALAESMSKVGTAINERVWRMPILPEHTSELDNPHADIASTGGSRAGGACTAAAFLQKFVDNDVKWAHLDIAGAGMYTKSKGEFCGGATGFGARLLVEWLAQAE